MTKKTGSIDKNKELETITAALMGVGVIVVIQLVSLAILDQALTLSLYSFAVAIPLLAMFLVNLISESTYTVSLRVWYNFVIFFVGVLFSLVGTGALFWHLSTVAGVLFTVLSFVGLFVTNNYRMELYKVNPSGIGRPI